MKKKLNVLVLMSPSNLLNWKSMQHEFYKYFEMHDTLDYPKNIKKYLNNGSFDLLFLDDPDKFELNYYKKFQINNPSFSYIVISKKPNIVKDIQILKNLADRIIYQDLDKKLYKWLVISALRRYWNAYSKPSIIIYKGIIADFIESKFIVDKKNVSLTPKEATVLRTLLTNRESHISKKKIFEIVWGYTEDNTRTVDQTLFKLKKKIGDSYIKIVRGKGIIIN